jgi:hypothetical protein
MKMVSWLVFVCVFVGCLACDVNYTSHVNVSDGRFLECMAFFEGRILGAAYWADEGMTRDGCFVTASGEIDSCHPFSAASKESLILGVIALALGGRAEAQLFLVAQLCLNKSLQQCQSLANDTAISVALQMLDKKMTSLEVWTKVV